MRKETRRALHKIFYLLIGLVAAVIVFYLIQQTALSSGVSADHSLLYALGGFVATLAFWIGTLRVWFRTR